MAHLIVILNKHKSKEKGGDIISVTGRITLWVPLAYVIRIMEMSSEEKARADPATFNIR